ncbi:MAG: type II toxin-antitoxin system VapC family toxin [Rhodocyclaceae bacterium]|jgi:ribonuclease VapC|nr:type II toxin-antitoxin system VapC family toxin [Rhodocyclaceae bacterium]MBK6553765.1 type II toxin-antitoxin system VapC family toxin [Rhodocyclaceae bacterium]MBK6678297.1 type II toxin-antitoxin system VapC family toxin [Rhodocyclaceae bacterium]MBK9310957.1 type II toxin-antitoxin system VapC family toxin [Rhodocyclaceae bacterium]
MNHVLDASAVLAWILKEPGSERVRELMESGNCLLSGVNAAEVVAKLADKDRPAAALRQVVAHIGAECIPFDAAQATEAGLLRPLTRHLGLSLGDRACLALARLRGAAVITTDRPWLQLAQPLGLSIECIRP